MSKISLQEASDDADAIMLGTLRAVRPELNWVHGPSLDSGCGSYKIDGNVAASMSRKVIVMTIVSEVRRGSLLGVIERHWKQQGYIITGVDSHEKTPAIFARTPEGLRMSVSVGKKGQFFLRATTPCFIQSEVSPPRTPGTGTPFEGPVIPDPHVHSAFWSATTPAPLASPTP
ncbi:hypothetical protein [Streptomyces albipurpureus]|uniref:Uncharacterized protein n=1 Tax=Streptomyces albipurpureus TaxID=2897419 RepID=A0ABT0V0P5_9ACTN|nr:hypothetical protein [Streptomyces sp. CWNU-1]MCM2393128.1 hypothetical protein [Streptomyces sp. CWNU-1]